MVFGRDCWGRWCGDKGLIFRKEDISVETKVGKLMVGQAEGGGERDHLFVHCSDISSNSREEKDQKKPGKERESKFLTENKRGESLLSHKPHRSCDPRVLGLFTMSGQA